MSDFQIEDVQHGIEIQGVYDGVCVWVMKDGTWVNRFRLPGYEGWERRAERVDAWIALHHEAAS